MNGDGRYPSKRVAAFVVLLLLFLMLGGCGGEPSQTASTRAASEAGKSAALSADQAKILDVFGLPDQFMISYLPQRSGTTMRLARTETWFYGKHRSKISFVSGKSFSVDDYRPPPGKIVYPKLRPQDFYYSMDYRAVLEAAGNPKVVNVAFMDDLFEDEGLRSYQGKTVSFTLEGGRLTHLQTLGRRAR